MILFALVGVLAAVATRAATQEGSATLPDGGTVTWRTDAEPGTVAQSFRFSGADGRIAHELAFKAHGEAGEIAALRAEVDGASATLDPADPDSREQVRRLLADRSGLAGWAAQALEVMPWDSPRDTVHAVVVISSGGGRGEHGPGPVSGYGDCYVDCVEEAREKCEDDCGEMGLLYPACIGPCLTAAALGCGLGCL